MQYDTNLYSYVSNSLALVPHFIIAFLCVKKCVCFVSQQLYHELQQSLYVQTWCIHCILVQLFLP